jgi:TatD DNase family protein
VILNHQSPIANRQSPILSDSHCHLQMTADPPALIERARAAGVRRFLVPGTTLSDSAAAVALTAAHDGVFAGVGVHPHEAKDFDPARDGPVLEGLARQAGVVAIGEVGLDFHYDHSPRKKQIEVLEWMMDCARRCALPLLLHNRESGVEMLAILKRGSSRENAGVFHSFTENADYGKKARDLGYLVSFSGMITFRAGDNVRSAAAVLPLEAMLVETDTPYLAPVPHRGKPCEPAFVVETAKKLAEVKGVDLDTVAAVTTANFERLFRPPSPPGSGGAPGATSRKTSVSAATEGRVSR